MKPLRRFTAVASPVLLGALLGCHSTPPPAPQADYAQPATLPQQTAQATPVPPPQHPSPSSNDEPQIDDQTEAAVRGSQTINFAVSAAGKPLPSAAVTVRTARGKIAAHGTTDDWGEFHTSLAQGVYRVEVLHQGTKTIQTAHITPDTQEIDLKLDPAPNE
jgi:hypothetical protein